MKKSPWLYWKWNKYILISTQKLATSSNILKNKWKEEDGKAQTGKEEQISAIAIPTNQVKNDTTTHPQTRLAGPAYWRLEPYRGVIPVKRVIVENDIASVLNKVCIKLEQPY